MGKCIDMTNQICGELKVIRKATKKEVLEHTSGKDTSAYWWVQCSCGAPIFMTRGKDLRSGKTKSCGHLRYEIGEQKIKNIKGQKFGHLEVLDFVGIDKHRAIWHCKCDCGNEKDIVGSLLINNKVKSCGCRPDREKYSHPTDLSNKQIGYLQPLYITDKRTSNGNVIWHCKCLACGNEKDISAHTLQVGKILSCGCIHSKGEAKIRSILEKNNIIFEEQKTFIDCISPLTNTKLRFDFYIDNKYLVEYDGEQHFLASPSGWNTEKSVIDTQYRDNIKNQWCKDNNIHLIRIPYTHFEELKLEDLLLNSTNFLVI